MLPLLPLLLATGFLGARIGVEHPIGHSALLAALAGILGGILPGRLAKLATVVSWEAVGVFLVAGWIEEGDAAVWG